MPLRSLESYGFVPDGQAWRYVTEHGTGLDSPLPVNTHGGHLSEAYLHGMNGVLEAVRQLRGTARQPGRRTPRSPWSARPRAPRDPGEVM